MTVSPRHIAIFAVIALAALVQADNYIHRPPSWSDLSFDYASARAARDGGDAYAPIVPLVERYVGHEGTFWTPEQRNSHPPGLILLVAPLTFMRPTPLQALWLVLSAAAAIIAIYLVAREIGVSAPLAWVLGAGVIATPLAQDALMAGNMECLILLAVVLAWRSMRRDRDAWAGVLIGLVAAVKLYPALLLIPLWRRRRTTVALTTLSVALLWSAAAVAFVGLHSAANWFQKAGPDNLAFYATSGANVSLAGRLLAGLTGGWTEAPGYAPVIYAAGAGVTIFALLRTRSFWGSVPWILLGVPLAWTTYAILVLPLIVILFYRLVPRVPLAVATAIVLLGTRVPFGLDQVLGQFAYALPTLSLVSLGWLAAMSRPRAGDDLELGPPSMAKAQPSPA